MATKSPKNKPSGKTVDEKLNKLTRIVNRGFIVAKKDIDTIDDKLNNLAGIVSRGFIAAKKDVDTKIDELAATVAQGFAETVTKTEFNEFREEMYGFRDRTDKRLFNLETRVNQIEINLAKLSDTVEKFIHIVELQREETRALHTTVLDLKRRVEKLESQKIN